MGITPAQSAPGRPWPASSPYPSSGAAPWSLVLPGESVVVVMGAFCSVRIFHNHKMHFYLILNLQ